ncbi:peptide chain release factor 1 [bacterium]|nr:peptide chain release factor 1 [bacterium]
MNLKSLLKKLNLRIEKLEKLLLDNNNPKTAKELSVVQNQRDYLKKYLSLKKKLAETKAIKDPELKELASEEVKKLKQELKTVKKELFRLLVEDPTDRRNAILEIHAGTGGDEAELFASDLLRMYLRFAERKGFKSQILDWQKTPLGGIKEAKILIKGEKAYGLLKFEGGVHRVQRVPQTEKKGRVHTSAAAVVVLPEAETIDIEIKPEELRIDTFRSSGPGGQSVNTTDSAVRITHLPTSTVVSCQDEKSQHKNKEKALKILRSKLLALRLEKEQNKEKEKRKTMVGKLDRSDKIRTYNFPQNRITDHRINLTIYALEKVLEGDLDPIIKKLQDAEVREKIKSL